MDTGTEATSRGCLAKNKLTGDELRGAAKSSELTGSPIDAIHGRGSGRCSRSNVTMARRLTIPLPVVGLLFDGRGRHAEGRGGTLPNDAAVGGERDDVIAEREPLHVMRGEDDRAAQLSQEAADALRRDATR